MPIFEYHCPRCDADFEEIVRSAETAVTCASCGHAGVSRKLSVFAFRSKGSDRPSASSGSSSCSGCSASSCSGCSK